MKRFLLSLMLLCIMIPASVAFAVEWPEACPDCGNTDLEWYPLTMSDGVDTHTKACFACHAVVCEIYEPCELRPGSATCLTSGRCKVCNFMLSDSGPDPDAHDWSETEYQWQVLGPAGEDGIPLFSCSASHSCRYGCGKVETETVTASAAVTTPSTCTTLGIITYTATFEADWARTQTNPTLAALPVIPHTEEIDEAVPSTCTDTGLTEGSHCSECGEILVEQEVAPVIPHSEGIIEAVDATCTKSGTTTYGCTVCDDTYTETTAALGHWYDLWRPDADGLHSADCRRDGCDHVGSTECTLYEVTPKEGETALTVCPVCGDHGDAPFGVVDGAAIKAAYSSDALPYGEPIVRGLEAPFGGALYAFTAAYESAGKVMPFKGTVAVTLPLDAEKYAGFDLVRVDVTPATETAGRAETWTAVPFTHEGGQLTFKTDAAGLFLLIPQE